jgi:thioredoxin 1
MTTKTKWVLVAALSIAVLAAYNLIQGRSPSSGPQSEAVSVRPSEGWPSTGIVTMIDLGATECIPCKMMAPILEELKREYAGRADIIFIDVYKDPSQVKRYGIRAIPTQIFFDREGREVFRHTGFMDKRRIVDELAKLGVS